MKSNLIHSRELLVLAALFASNPWALNAWGGDTESRIRTGGKLNKPSTGSVHWRIDPQNCVIQLAEPIRSIVVIGELLVEEGMEVQTGQVLAVLVEIEVLRTELERLSGALANAEKELEWH